MVLDWIKAPAFADRHFWDHNGIGYWGGWYLNDWINTYAIWDSEFEKSDIPMPKGWDYRVAVLRNS